MEPLHTPHKTGPKPKGHRRYNVIIPPDLAEWAKDEPEGLSGLVRLALARIRAQRRRQRPPAP